MLVKAQVIDDAAMLLGESIESYEPLAGGGNNTLFRIVARSGTYALKLFRRVEGAEHDRFTAEARALHFLARVVPGRVPAVIATDADARLLVCEWINGEQLTQADAAAIDDCVAFFAALHAARERVDAVRLGLAAEACLSTPEIIRQIEARLAQFGSIVELHDLLETATALLQRACQAAGRCGFCELAPRDRTLSAADVGLHNALRRAGRLVFLDFEYFGWDDPVKCVADFVWHPAMTLDSTQCHQFLTQSADIYRDDASFRTRLAAQLPLYGLRWALIVLNEFLPARWAARVAAGASDAHAVRCARQYAKAQGLLEGVAALLDGVS